MSTVDAVAEPLSRQEYLLPQNSGKGYPISLISNRTCTDHSDTLSLVIKVLDQGLDKRRLRHRLCALHSSWNNNGVVFSLEPSPMLSTNMTMRSKRRDGPHWTR